ncbi:parallel beta-helix repeat (two copies) [Halogranum rubrum]|uniref:Parallel beta-helix repeat (Two copies) n=1 Tax=Halogranum rubrum TaxID=553466 RepID=A0A1I4IXB8_9EURY|nr:right-handed parallel beta-helix repeat-containing protein [Halogranum rubrum]SFL58677.1 parallel beta-helix repeat (two copies) [Halogranum rubrum]
MTYQLPWRTQYLSVLLVAALMIGTVGASTLLVGAQNGNNTVGPAEISSCTVIDEPGRYILTQDIEDPDANVCVDIQASDVHFDGNSYTVDSGVNESVRTEVTEGPFPEPQNVSVGIGIDTSESLSNVTVSNATVVNSIFGVYGTNLSDARVEDATASNNTFGVFINNSSDSVVTDSAAMDNVVDGIVFESLGGRPVSNNTVSGSVTERNGALGIAVGTANDSMVSDSIARENGVDGILLFSTKDTIVTNVTTSNNGDAGIKLLSGDGFASSNNTVVDATSTGNLYGTLAAGHDEVTISNVTARENAVVGISVNRSSNHTITDNAIIDNGYIGLRVANAEGSVVSDNVILETQGVKPADVPFPSGSVLLFNVSDTTFNENRVVGNNASGVVVRDGSDTVLLLSNNASANARDGIVIDDSEAVALATNIANDNGDDGIEVNNSRQVWLLLNILEGNDNQAVEITDSRNVVRIDSVKELRDLLERLFSEERTGD